MKQQFLLKSSSFLVTSVILGGSVPQSVSANNLEKFVLYMWSLFLNFFETKSDKVKKSGEELAKFFIEKMETELKEYSKYMKYDEVKDEGERFIKSFLEEMEKKFEKCDKNVEYDKIKEEGKKLIESFIKGQKNTLALNMQKVEKVKKSGEELAKFFIEKMETELKEYSKYMKYDEVKDEGERFIKSFLKETEKKFEKCDKNVEYDKIKEEGKKLIESFIEGQKNTLALNMQKVEEDKKQLAELCEKLQLESKTDEKGNIIMNFDTDPKKFQPKFYARSHSASGDGYYPVHKIVYDVSCEKLFMYSLGDNFGEPLGDNFGEHPMRFDCLTVEQYAQRIFDEYKIFETNPMGKVKEGLKEFFKNINWSKNKKENNDRVCKGTVNVQGVDFPISLRLRMKSEDQFYCKVDFVDYLDLNCSSFGTKEKDKLTCWANRLTYCVSQLKKLENTGKFEKVFFDAENGHLAISLKEGCAIKCEARYSFREESSNVSVVDFDICRGITAYALKAGGDIAESFWYEGNDDFAKKEKNRLEKFIDSICKKFSESKDSIDVSAEE